VKDRTGPAATRRTVIVAGTANILVGWPSWPDEIDSRLSEKLPLRPHVFIDPTQTGGRRRRVEGSA